MKTIDTPFVGREVEKQQLSELRGWRVLTLVGPGGIGKSRLARVVAEAISSDFRHAIGLVDLDAASAKRNLWQALLRATGDAGSRQDRLIDRHSSHELLLVLDNCDAQLANSAELAADVVRETQHVQVLATSREPLRVDAELVWVVPPLSTPQPDWVDPDQISASDAVRLFLRRMQDLLPEFALTVGNANRVAWLCHHSGGSPLLLEAAAARVAVDGLARVCANLAPPRWLDLADGTRRLARHQSLRASLDWDYALLDDSERLLLARLSLFCGGWTLEAAEDLCVDELLPVAELRVRLSRLVARSLVEVDDAAQPRMYRMADAVREYVQQLPRPGLGEAAFERRRAARLIEVGARVPPARLDRTVADALYREREDLHAALAWAIGVGDVDIACKLCTLGYVMWYRRRLFTEGRWWLRRLLSSRVQGRQRATIACLAGHLALLEGEIAAARDLVREALTACTSEADAGDAARIRHLQVQIALSTGDNTRARALIAASELAARDPVPADELGDMFDGALLIASACLALELQDVHRAARLAALAGATAREREDRFWLARTLRVQALVAAHLQEHVGARWLMNKAIEVQVAEDDADGLVDSLCGLGQIELNVGSLHSAGRAFRRAFDLAAQAGLRVGMLQAIDGIVCAEAASRPQNAMQLAMAGASLRQSTGAFAWPRQRRQLLACLQTGLGHPPLAGTLDTRAAAPNMSWDSVVNLVHDLPEPDVADDVDAPEILTAREREVAGLLMHGLSNQQIALRLTISVGTVRAHVEHILIKLGLHSRAQVASWALETHRLFA